MLVLVLAASGGLAWFLYARHVTEVDVMSVTLADGRRFEAVALVGPRGTPPGALRLVGVDGAPVWRRLEERPHGMASEHDGHVLYRHGGQLTWVEIDSGRAVWDVPDEVDYSTQFFVGDDVVDAYEIPYTPRQCFRRRSLADGSVRWNVELPSLGESARWELRHAHGEVFLDASSAILRLHLEDGTLERLVPESAEAVCTDAEEDVAYRDASSRLWFRRAGGEPVEIGAAAPGDLACARVGGRPWIVWRVEWSYDRPVGRPPPAAPDVTPLADGRAPASASGALWWLREDDTLAWAIATGWGVPELAEHPPRGMGSGRITLRVTEEPEELGEELGSRGGGSMDVILDEASGQLL